MITDARKNAVARQRAGWMIFALTAGTLFLLRPYLGGLLGAGILYVLAFPSYAWIARHMPAQRAALLVTLVATVLILIPGVWLIGMIVNQAPGAMAMLESNTVLAKLSTMHLGRIDVGAQLSEASGAIVSWFSRQTLRLFSSAAHAVLNLVVALFGLFFLLPSGDTVWKRVRSYLPFSEDGAELLRAKFHSVTLATFLGTALTAGAQGTVVGIGFLIFGLPSALFWGVMAAVVSVFPIVGSALVWVPAAIVIFAEGRTGAGIGFTALCAVVASNVDNLIRPLVNRRVSNLHPMVTLVGAAAGIEFMGLGGVLLGPLAISYVFALLDIYRLEYEGGKWEDTWEHAGSDS